MNWKSAFIWTITIVVIAGVIVGFAGYRYHQHSIEQAKEEAYGTGWTVGLTAYKISAEQVASFDYAYDLGYGLGYDDALETRDAYWSGYEAGREEGYDEGYDDAKAGYSRMR